jgi:hypothetical protein
VKELAGTILFLAIFAFAFAPQIGVQAGKFANAFQAERTACDPDHWDMGL